MSQQYPLAIIQARLGSTRLPGKALADINGAPLTEHVVRRTHRAIPDPVLAIPDTSPNDELEERATDWPCKVVRGPEEDVLGRFKLAMDEFPDADPILRVTGDNPLISSRLMEQLPEKLDGADWATWRWLPYGIGNSIYTRQSIEEAHEEATTDEDREHVTLYVRRGDEYRSNTCLPQEKYRAPGLRLTVDTEEDLRLIRTLYEETGADPCELASDDAINYLARHPELIDINRTVQQKVYNSRASVLYTMNRGGEWGTGHWARFTTIRRHSSRNNDANPRWHGLLGETDDDNDETAPVLCRSRNPLNGSTIKLWSRRSGAQLVIQDVKRTDESLVTSLKEEGVRMIGIEDRGPGRQHMEAVVDPNLYDDTLPDDNLPPDNRYYGPDYALIDPAFRKQRRPSTPDSFEQVGMFFGGTDPNRLGPRFLEVAPEIMPGVEFHYFGPHDLRPDDGTTGRQDDRTMGGRYDGTAGPGRRDDGTMGRQDDGTAGPGRRDDGTVGRHDDETTGRRDDWTIGRQDDGASEPSNSGRVKQRGFVENPAETFSEMDLMVIAGGVVKFEIACLNLPAVVIPQNKEQRVNTRRFIERNNLSWPLFDVDSTPEAWLEWFADHPPGQHLAEWGRNLRGTVDGRGLDRFYAIIDDLLSKEGTT